MIWLMGHKIPFIPYMIQRIVLDNINTSWVKQGRNRRLFQNTVHPKITRTSWGQSGTLLQYSSVVNLSRDLRLFITMSLMWDIKFIWRYVILLRVLFILQNKYICMRTCLMRFDVFIHHHPSVVLDGSTPLSSVVNV